MNVTRTTCWVPIVVILTAGTQPAPAQSLIGLGFLPGRNNSFGAAVNANGTVVVGSSYSTPAPGAEYRPFRWDGPTFRDLGTLVALPSSAQASGVSADGSRVVGPSFNNTDRFGFIWTNNSGGGSMVSLGSTPGGNGSSASAISADGLVVTGFTVEGNSEYAMRWSGNIMLSLGTLGDSNSYGTCIDADGSAIGGYYIESGSNIAFRWTSASGMISLGTMLNGTTTTALAMNSDGTVIVGAGNSNSGSIGFRWREGLGYEELLPPPEWLDAEALGVSSDGNVVVGSGLAFAGRMALIWSPAFGVASLQAYLANLGVDVTNWELVSAGAISADGTTITGYGRRGGTIEAWIARIPPLLPACPADLTNDRVVDDADFLLFLVGYNILDCLDPSMPAGCPADLDSDGVVTDADFGVFVVAYNQLVCR